MNVRSCHCRAIELQWSAAFCECKQWTSHASFVAYSDEVLLSEVILEQHCLVFSVLLNQQHQTAWARFTQALSWLGKSPENHHALRTRCGLVPWQHCCRTPLPCHDQASASCCLQCWTAWQRTPLNLPDSAQSVREFNFRPQDIVHLSLTEEIGTILLIFFTFC